MKGGPQIIFLHAVKLEYDQKKKKTIITQTIFLNEFVLNIHEYHHHIPRFL